MEKIRWNIADKNVLITGSNTGIGYYTALGLLKRNANVIIHGRDIEKGRKARENLIKQSGNKNVVFIPADFSSFNEVLELVDKVQEEMGFLDVLINNAGGYFPNRRLTPDGFEWTMQVNYLSPFLLTNELLCRGIIRKGRHGRIINVSSIAHKGAKLDLSDLMMEKRRYKGFLQYSNSKLAIILFTYELAERLEGTNITVNVLHPGVVRSEFLRNNKLLKTLSVLAYPFMISPSKGAENSIYLASSPDLTNITGKYFTHKRPKKTSKASYDVELRKNLWQKTEELIKEKIEVLEVSCN